MDNKEKIRDGLWYCFEDDRHRFSDSLNLNISNLWMFNSEVFTKEESIREVERRIKEMEENKRYTPPVEDDNYYKPDIEEFHVGFECEINTEHYCEGENWQKEEWSEEDSVNGIADIREYRVKHLDQEDIESLGFSFSPLGSHLENKEFLFGDKNRMKENGPTGNGFWVKWWGNTQHIEITDCTETLYSVLFKGNIKNKSELKRILNQIGYEAV